MGCGEGSGEGQGAGKGGCGPDCTCSEGCIRCSRVTLIIFNSIFLIIGLAMLGLGIWFVVDPNILRILQIAGGVTQGSGLVRIVAYVFLGAGGAIFIVSMFGLIGASRWNQCLLSTYVAFLVILMAAQIAIIVLGFLSSRHLGNELQNGMTNFILNDYDDSDTLLPNSWRRMQVQLRCCGVDGHEDWKNMSTKWWRETGNPANWDWPRTCCTLTNTRDPNSEPENEAQCRGGNPTYLNTQGCYLELESWLRRWGFAIGGAVAGMFVLQVFVLTFAGIVHKGVVSSEYAMNGVKPMVV